MNNKGKFILCGGRGGRREGGGREGGRREGGGREGGREGGGLVEFCRSEIIFTAHYLESYLYYFYSLDRSSFQISYAVYIFDVVLSMCSLKDSSVLSPLRLL